MAAPAVQDALAVVIADGRTCTARPAPGCGWGVASGPSVLTGCEAEVRAALDWMPGRIIVLTGAALLPRTLALVVPSVHMSTLIGVVLLADDDVPDLAALTAVDGVAPIVRVARASEQAYVRRAVRLVVDVHPEQPVDVRPGPAVDLRARRRPARAHRSRTSLQARAPGLAPH